MLMFSGGRKYLIDFPLSDELTRLVAERQSQQLEEAIAGIDPAELYPEVEQDEDEIEGLGVSQQPLPIGGESRVRLSLANGVSQNSSPAGWPRSARSWTTLGNCRALARSLATS